MVNYKLVYFNVKAKAELARLIFAQAGVEYEDERVTPEEWKDMKPTMPNGQLPVMYVDGVVIHQSMAIARYLARKYGLLGSDDLENAKIDATTDTVNEMFDWGAKVRFAPSDEMKAAAVTTLEEKVPFVINYVDKTLASSKSGWLHGAKVTMADFALFNTMHYFRDVPEYDKVREQLKGNPRIAQHHDKVANLPKIKEWVAKRPDTDL